jgi:hypothetical protein
MGPALFGCGTNVISRHVWFLSRRGDERLFAEAEKMRVMGGCRGRGGGWGVGAMMSCFVAVSK